MYGYLYYSIKCDYSRNIMKLMENHGLNKMFEYRCVDNMSLEEITQLQLNITPTLVMTNPNGKLQIYESEDAFVFIKNFLCSRRESLIKQAEATRKLIQSNNTKNNLKENLYGYCPDEQNGISDNYSTWNNDFNKDVTMALPKTFTQYNPNDTRGDSIMTIPIGNVKDYKAKESLEAVYGKDIKSVLAKMENDRKEQDKELAGQMEQNRFNTVVSALQ
jgi:hypothetical protein